MAQDEQLGRMLAEPTGPWLWLTVVTVWMFEAEARAWRLELIGCLRIQPCDQHRPSQPS
jgi:hypothetical protein